MGGSATRADGPGASADAQPFRRVNLGSVGLERVRAHDGEGQIRFARLLGEADVRGAVHFVDLAVLPPGASIGRHRHADDEEEYYLLLDGVGTMWQDGATFEVATGDLVRNPPGAAHGLTNTGTCDLRLFVFEVGVR